MEFSIRGIGIIKEADIKMDGLTVIARSNNSGKTTVQIAIQNGHLCHVRRSVCDIIGGQPKTN